MFVMRERLYAYPVFLASENKDVNVAIIVGWKHSR